MTNEQTFDDKLNAWSKGIQHSMKLAATLANEAIIHFRDHGDVAYIQKMDDAIKLHAKNYVRRAAFHAWLSAHLPISYVDGKFCKAKGKDFDNALVEKALTTPFFDFAPERPVVTWKGDDVVEAAKRAVKKYHKDNMEPGDEIAPLVLEQFEDYLTRFAFIPPAEMAQA